MHTLVTVLLTILTLANLFLMAVVAVTLKGRNDKASKVGFSFIELVFACNIIAILGGSF